MDRHSMACLQKMLYWSSTDQVWTKVSIEYQLNVGRGLVKGIDIHLTVDAFGQSRHRICISILLELYQ